MSYAEHTQGQQWPLQYDAHGQAIPCERTCGTQKSTCFCCMYMTVLEALRQRHGTTSIIYGWLETVLQPSAQYHNRADVTLCGTALQAWNTVGLSKDQKRVVDEFMAVMMFTCPHVSTVGIHLFIAAARHGYCLPPSVTSCLLTKCE